MKALVRSVLIAALVLLVALVGLVALGGQAGSSPSPAATPGTASDAAVAGSSAAHAEAPACGPSDDRTAGAVAFGTHLDPGTQNLSCRASAFPFGSAFAWRATFDQPVTPGDVTVVIARIIGTSEQVAKTATEVVTTPNATSLGAQADAGMLGSLGPGSYVFRVMAGTTVLAEGRFQVTP
jgi:hypothetical protein